MMFMCFEIMNVKLCLRYDLMSFDACCGLKLNLCI
jgi:hypothetical protein